MKFILSVTGTSIARLVCFCPSSDSGVVADAKKNTHKDDQTP